MFKRKSMEGPETHTRMVGKMHRYAGKREKLSRTACFELIIDALVSVGERAPQQVMIFPGYGCILKRIHGYFSLSNPEIVILSSQRIIWLLTFHLV